MCDLAIACSGLQHTLLQCCNEVYHPHDIMYLSTQQTHPLQLFALQMRLANRYYNNSVCKIIHQSVQWLASAFTHKFILILGAMHGRTDCELETLYCKARIILPKPDELCAGQWTHYLISPVTFL